MDKQNNQKVETHENREDNIRILQKQINQLSADLIAMKGQLSQLQEEIARLQNTHRPPYHAPYAPSMFGGPQPQGYPNGGFGTPPQGFSRPDYSQQQDRPQQAGFGIPPQTPPQGYPNGGFGTPPQGFSLQSAHRPILLRNALTKTEMRYTVEWEDAEGNWQMESVMARSIIETLMKLEQKHTISFSDKSVIVFLG